MAKRESKTNAMRILESMKIPFLSYTYECDEFIDAIQIAEELDLKKAARSVGEKSVELVHVKDINKITGYIRGGCTAVGMKKQYVTRIDSGAEALPTVIVSGGRLGMQIELKPDDLKQASDAEYTDIIRRPE